MSDSKLIFEGESYEDALRKGLKKLELNEDQVTITIVEEKKESFFRKALTVLEITPNLVPNEVIKSDENIAGINKLKEDTQPPEFSIEFTDQGVFLSVVFFNKPTELLALILDYIKTKNVKEVDSKRIKAYIDETNPEPIQIAPPQEEVLIDEDVEIDLSKDKMQCFISLTEAYGGKEASLQDIKEKLKEYGVTYGIEEEAIISVLNHKKYKEKSLIAVGKKPINGDNAKIQYEFDIKSLNNPQILEDGSVDFKQLNLIKNVSVNDLLAEIIPPTEGFNGCDVLGNIIPAQPGKALNFKRGKNTIESEDGLKLYASTNGQVFIKDGAVVVSEVFEVPRDVDNSTGNIKFNGKVIVKGNVKSGFSIEADGDIIVYGVVEGAKLKANGNIILNRGVQGNNQAYLECTGNLITKYIENASLKVEGNIEADCILHSNSIAKAKVIISGKKGLIAGGEVKAGEEIRAITMGSHMGTSTKLEVGSDPEEKRRFNDLKNEISDIENKLDGLKKTIDLLTRLSKNASLTADKEEIFIRSLKSYEVLKETHSALVAEAKELEEKQATTSRGKVHVAKTVYPGVRVTILNVTRQFNDELSNCTLYLKEGDITIGPFEK